MIGGGAVLGAVGLASGLGLLAPGYLKHSITLDKDEDWCELFKLFKNKKNVFL